VGPELRCRDAMRQGITLQDRKRWGIGSQTVWLFKSRKSAVTRFTALCVAQKRENERMRQEHAETARKAQAGDMAAVLALGDF